MDIKSNLDGPGPAGKPEVYFFCVCKAIADKNTPDGHYVFRYNTLGSKEVLVQSNSIFFLTTELRIYLGWGSIDNGFSNKYEEKS
jgi:hypothetical protein